MLVKVHHVCCVAFKLLSYLHPLHPLQKTGIGQSLLPQDYYSMALKYSWAV